MVSINNWLPYPEAIAAQEKSPLLAVIREAECIGCTKCIQACPVDAIIGSAKQMHTVLINECTGCGLCVAPCPVDCIDMQEIALRRYQPAKVRARYYAQQQRKNSKEKETVDSAATTAKKSYIQAAIERVRNKKSLNSK